MRVLPTSSKYWSEEQGRAVVEAWRQSGEPATVFARRHGLHAKRLAYWNRRLSRDEPAPTLSLVRATVISADLAAVIRIGGVTVELSNATPDQIAVIAQALARPTP
jgi:transposase-like protein